MFWPMMTSSQESHFLVNFWDFSKNFSKIFLKIYKIWTKFSTFQGNFYLNECYTIFMASHGRVGSLSGFWDFFTKLHRSSWMSDVLPSAPRLFLKCGLLHRQVLGQRIQLQRSIFCAESLAVHTAVACIWLVARYYS